MVNSKLEREYAKKQDQIELERSASFQCSMFCELCTVGEVA